MFYVVFLVLTALLKGNLGLKQRNKTLSKLTALSKLL